jgi:hypothetical protein
VTLRVGCLFALAFLFAASVIANPRPTQAAEIRLARQFSMGYLQFNVMEHQQLIEKHATALGLPDLKVTWLTFNGPAAVNDALLSGTIDIASGGAPGLLLLWSKTKGTPNEVRGIAAMSSQPFLLNTRNPAIKSLADVKDTDRIAVPAVKVSIQAIALQMAAAKTFGPAKRSRCRHPTQPSRCSAAAARLTWPSACRRSNINNSRSPEFRPYSIRLTSWRVRTPSHWHGHRHAFANRIHCFTRR